MGSDGGFGPGQEIDRIEREQVLKVTDRYSIKDMELVLEVDNNVI